jgi:hypothetical protein
VMWATIGHVDLFWRKFSRYTRSEAALERAWLQGSGFGGMRKHWTV